MQPGRGLLVSLAALFLLTTLPALRALVDYDCTNY
jgi:hypothetical protein